MLAVTRMHQQDNELKVQIKERKNCRLSGVTTEKSWQNLAECDRAALNSALSENRDLHNRITELEHENIRLKVLLSEAKSLVEVLTVSSGRFLNSLVSIADDY